MTCVRIPDENEIALATGFPSRMARLRHLVAIGAEARWGKPIPAATAQRLEEELSFIERVSASDPRLDFASYFLIIRDCVKDVRGRGALAGPWRGAASGSAVAYALGITTVDPVKHGLFFERFLGQSRIALPPVWLDFDAEGHETAVRHISDRYRECGLETPSRIIIEFHALKPLSVQRKCLRLVAERSGIDIDLERIPDSDQATMSVFADADTRDIFQFGSPEAMRWLRQIRPSCLADITAIGTLFYSPGLAMLFSDIVSRKNGERPVECGHPLMESVLNETYGAVIYQEQIMSLAQRLAGFTRGESDTLRYAMGKKMFDDTEKMKAKFIAGCLANPAFRVGEWRGESAAKSLFGKIWADWWSVSSIAFNKSHAVAYTRLAWQSAYLKAHHPREYAEAFDFCYNVGEIQELDEGNMIFHAEMRKTQRQTGENTMDAYNCFLQDCKERLIKAASPKCKFGGAYNGRGKYAHILRDPEQRYLLIADERFRNEDACKPLFGGKVHFQTYSHHVNSSQLFCINVFAPLMTGKHRSQNMKSFLNSMGVNLKGDIVYSSERATAGTRFEYKPAGKDRTNFDFYVVTSLNEKVFFEIKYTESEFGRPQNGSRKESEWAFYKQLCDSSRYLSGLSQESFYSNFQINRNIGHITQNGNEFVVFVFPYSNPSLKFPFIECAKMKRVKVCFAEQLGKIADKAFPRDQALREYYHDLVQRYFGF